MQKYGGMKKYSTKKIINRYIYLYSMRSNEKNNKNKMIKWKDENNIIEDDGTMAKKQEIE